MKVPFHARAGILISGNSPYLKATWPLGSVSLDTHQFILNGVIWRITLSVDDIDQIKPLLLGAEIDHHSRDCGSLVQVFGFRIYSSLSNIIREMSLPIRTCD